MCVYACLHLELKFKALGVVCVLRCAPLSDVTYENILNVYADQFSYVTFLFVCVCASVHLSYSTNINLNVAFQFMHVFLLFIEVKILKILSLGH